MEDIRLIDIKEQILSDNLGLAERLRGNLSKQKVFFLNVMGSPGTGKTSFIIKTIENMAERYRIAVVEADIDSLVDSRKVAALGIPTVQIRTGGFCHVDASMVEKAIESLPLENLDLFILENVGNLVCPAEVDTGAFKNVVLLSIPEGDDKPLKYPLIFSVSDVLVINKLDYLEIADFDLKLLSERVQTLNQSIPIFPLSCKTSLGFDNWVDWLEQEMLNFQKDPKWN
jgi:hydrogenase nickel incorporation protein HypB